MLWQVQEAKQRFSELLRVVHADGPQFITRHGHRVAVIIDIEDYRHLRHEQPDLKEYLMTGPHFDDLELTRDADLPRAIDWEQRS